MSTCHHAHCHSPAARARAQKLLHQQQHDGHHACYGRGGPRTPGHGHGPAAPPRLEDFTPTDEHTKMLWKMLLNREVLEFHEWTELDPHGQRRKTSRRRRVLHDKLVDYARLRDDNEDEDLRDLFEGYLSGRYPWDAMKRTALSLLKSDRTRVEQSMSTILRALRDIEGAMARGREAEISRNIMIAVGDDPDVMIMDEENKVLSLAALKYELGDCQLLMNMALGGIETLNRELAFWVGMRPDKMPRNTRETTGKGLVKKSGLDWEKTLGWVAEQTGVACCH